MLHKTLRALLYPIPLLWFLVFTVACQPNRTEGQMQDDELQMGQEGFNQLEAKGEMVESTWHAKRKFPL